MMTDDDEKKSPPAPRAGNKASTPLPTRSDERLDREAMALRENLRRRKDQARARSRPAPTPDTPNDGES